MITNLNQIGAMRERNKAKQKKKKGEKRLFSD